MVKKLNNIPRHYSSTTLNDTYLNTGDVVNNLKKSDNPSPVFNHEKSQFFGSFRMCVVLMLMFNFFCLTSVRMNLGMAIVCMVNSTAINLPQETSLQNSLTTQNLVSVSKLNNNNSQEKCSRNVNNYKTDLQSGYQGSFLWTPVMQSQLFSAVYYGSFLTVWIAGYLADRFSSKLMLVFTLADSTIITFLTPFLANTNYKLFFAARFLMGVGEGFFYPATSTIAARWFPPEERSRMAAFYTTGNQLASVVGFLVSAQLCRLSFLGGWTLIFYLFGFITMLALIFWIIFGSTQPKDSCWVSKKESDFIHLVTSAQFEKKEIMLETNCLAPRVLSIPENNTKKVLTNIPIPWRSIITSLPIYAILAAQSGFSFTVVILQSYLPTYFKEVLHLDLHQNGLFSVIPFAVQIISKLFYGYMSDTLKRRKILSSTTAAKLFQSIGLYCFYTLSLPSPINLGSFGCTIVFLCLALFVNCDRVPLAAITLVLYGLFFSAGICGFYTSMLSIAPVHTGLIVSISTTFSLFACAAGPIIVAFCQQTGNDSKWMKIFLIVAAINGTAGVIFLIFGSASIQEWACAKHASNSQNDKVQPVQSNKLDMNLILDFEGSFTNKRV